MWLAAIWCGASWRVGKVISAMRGQCAETLRLSEAALRLRIDELDAVVGEGCIHNVAYHSGQNEGAAIEHFVRVMSSWTAPRVHAKVRMRPVLREERADALCRDSSLVAYLGRVAPELVTGPLDTSSQLWTTTGRSPSNGCGPSEEHFVAPHRRHSAVTQPHEFGLWTSTASLAGVSMWRAYMEPERHPGGAPVPWHTWLLRIEAGVKVVEIRSAVEWTKLACLYPRACAGRLYPDWVAIAQEFDAVHMTLPAVVAVQGFYFKTPWGVLPTTSWDVESTLWLKWRCSGAELVETVGCGTGG